MKLRLICIFLITLLFSSCGKSVYVVSQNENGNDLVTALDQNGCKVVFCPSMDEAISKATEKTPIIVLADNYPETGESILSENMDKIQAKSLRVLVEFPSQIGEQKYEKRDPLDLERIVIYDSLSVDLPKMGLLTFNKAILAVNENKNIDTLMVAAKVAGFDSAVYGLKDTPTLPVLYYLNDNLLVASTKISDFSKCMYRPENKVQAMFDYIFQWLFNDSSFKFKTWIADVVPSYGENVKLPKDAALKSVERGVQWYYNAHLLVDASWKSEWADKYMGDGLCPVGPCIPDSLKDGDGSLGVLEGHTSAIDYEGKQLYRYWMRDDVQGESAFAFAAGASLTGNKEWDKVSENLLDYSFSEFRDGPRNDPKSPSYGLLGWAYTHKYVYYGDDNARSILGSAAASSLLKNNKWDKDIVECIVGNFRTTGINGFRDGRLEDQDLQKNGWRWYFERDLVNPHPHFESWNWACYLWLYEQTHYEPLLERVKKGMKIMMDSYPKDWKWTNGIQQERARMLLPLAWMYRVEPTEEHLEWVNFMTDELLKNQAACGGIREELGDASNGMFGKLTSNASYGLNEAPLIFDNGDPVADMLYTTNFAFLGLCEVANSTQNPKYLEALDKMKDFLIRIQVSSKDHKNVDGAWFRAFNYQDWNYWASNADAGWGAWSTLSGWIQSWIVGTICMTEENTSLWDLMAAKDVKAVADQVIKSMITENKD